MNRRGLVIISGLLLSVCVVSPSWSQTSTNQRKTLGQRMADLRRGWSGNDAPSANEDIPTPQAQGESTIPNWLSSGKQQPANAQQSNNAQSGAPRQSPQRANGQITNQNSSAARTTGQNNSAAAPSAKTNGFSQPGNGGAKLPASTTAGAPANRYPTTTQGDPNYPVIRDIAPTNQPSNTTAANSEPRHSPAPRTASNGPVERVAQANERYATNGQTTVDAPQDTADEAQSSTMPPLDAGPSIGAASAEPASESSSARQATSNNQREPQTAEEAFGAPDTSRRPIGASEFARSPRSNAHPEQPSAAHSREAFGEALQVASGGDPSVLASNQAAVITTDIRGPKQITVGREAVYRVRLQNQSSAKAERIVATIRVPASAEVVAATATEGTVQPTRNPSQPTQLEWQLSSLDARGSQVLDIRLIPRESKPLELGVNWTTAPAGSRAIVEVQEPMIKIEIGGPAEVLFDKPQVFRLTISNPGTGPAENVRIDLVPPGGTPETATSHTFGDLAPGDSKSVEIELTAREAGKLMMKAIASAEGGLKSDAAKEIFCRKPELQVDWRGPATKYAGTPATYFFRVRNPGTGPAEDVLVQVTLPEGADFTTASEGQEYDAKTRQVSWHAGTLNPGDDNYMELKCVVNAPGANQFKIAAATAAGDLTDSKVAETTVEALADLKLTVSDPSGPVAVGTPAMYEIHVENRGANSAKNVNVVALFSEGIEPDQAEGGTYTVADGRVSFKTIDEIAAGRDVTLRVRARALKPGTHVFRAEVLCSELDIKLAAEETTRFYADEVLPDSDAQKDQTSSRQGFDGTTR
jgi:uncharacterized repeat protein (TIGR01451 family)